jgi:hypothetical protein
MTGAALDPACAEVAAQDINLRRVELRLVGARVVEDGAGSSWRVRSNAVNRLFLASMRRPA